MESNRRILIVDDNPSIHRDFQNLLESRLQQPSVDEAAAVLFGEEADAKEKVYEIGSAHQGVDGLNLVRDAVAIGRPYALAFVDIRMPPGWDGIETVSQLWRADPELQVVLCTAYSDYTYRDILDRLGAAHRLLMLRKPFDVRDVRLMVTSLVERWDYNRRQQRRIQELESRVADLEAGLELNSSV